MATNEANLWKNENMASQFSTYVDRCFFFFMFCCSEIMAVHFSQRLQVKEKREKNFHRNFHVCSLIFSHL